MLFSFLLSSYLLSSFLLSQIEFLWTTFTGPYGGILLIALIAVSQYWLLGKLGGLDKKRRCYFCGQVHA